MGFSKEIVQERIIIPLAYRVTNKDTDTESEVNVSHVFRRPTTREREEYNRLAIRVKGRRVLSDSSTANWWLWKRCIVEVVGYDDLPSNGQWRDYFDDDIGRIHVDDATARFMEKLTGDEGEVEKKFEPSSEL